MTKDDIIKNLFPALKLKLVEIMMIKRYNCFVGGKMPYFNKIKISLFVLLLTILPLSLFSQSGVYTLNGGSASQDGKTYSATLQDQSAVFVLNSGNLELTNCTMNKNGDSSNTDLSFSEGINSAVLSYSQGKIIITGGSISSGASGGNGAYSYGSGTSITLKNLPITTTKDYSSGICSSNGGNLTAKSLTLKTNGTFSKAIAVLGPSSSLTIDEGSYYANSTATNCNSPAIYSEGNLSISNGDCKSRGDDGVVIYGGTLSLNNTTLEGAKNGIKIAKNSASTSSVTINISSSTIKAISGDAILTTEDAPKTQINFSGRVTTTASSSNIINHTSQGSASITLNGATVEGNISGNSKGSLSLDLKGGSNLTGEVENANVSLDSSSMWIVTKDSTIQVIKDSSGITNLNVTNITGNGNSVYYDPNLSDNSYLGGLSYSLVNGGYLAPIGGGGCTIICEASSEPTSGPAPLAVTFSGKINSTTCDGTPVYFWDFGDGTTSTEQNPAHTYIQDGGYLWTFTVTIGDKSCEQSARILVDSSDPCVLTCSSIASPLSGQPPLTVSFTSNITTKDCNEEVTYFWDFGDGGTSTEQNPSHTYTQIGKYFYQLTVKTGTRTCTSGGSISVEESSGPKISGITQATNPYRLRVLGEKFVSGADILIDGKKVPQTVFKSPGYLIAKKGSSLKSMVPKGVTVKVQVKNPDGSLSNEYNFTR